MRQGYQSTVKFVVELLTERYWLLDYLPTFFKKREGVLLVRLDLIGDFVLWLDSAQAYRRLYPDQKITLVVNSASAELAHALSHWDEVIALNVHKLRTDHSYRIGELIKLRLKNFKTAIQPTFSREFVGDIIVRASFAPVRIGYHGNTNNIIPKVRAVTNRWYTKLIFNCNYEHSELDINANFVRSLGLTHFKSQVPTIPDTHSKSPSSVPNSPYIVIAPGASWLPKAWPVSNFADVISTLAERANLQFIICGGPADTIVCRELVSLLPSTKLLNLCDRTSLLELVEVIRGAALVITNDSAPAHIAIAVSTPSLCILGGGHYGRFLPYTTNLSQHNIKHVTVSSLMSCFGCNWECGYLSAKTPTAPCVANVTTKAVADYCIDILKSHFYIN
jgi:ADP-heptose:LPS heptosyltransferase